MFKRFFFFALPLAILFSACIIPEKFTLDIYINADGTYYYSFKGNVVISDMLQEVHETGKIADDTTYMEHFMELDDIDEQVFSKIEYKGKGRGYIEYMSKKTAEDLVIGFVTNFSEFGAIESVNNEINIYYDNSRFLEFAEELKSYNYVMSGVISIHSELPMKQNSSVPDEANISIRDNMTDIKIPFNDIAKGPIEISFLK